MAHLCQPLTACLWPGATFDVVNREYVAMVLNMAYSSNLTGADVVAATAEEAVGFLNAGIVLLRLLLGVKTLSLAIMQQPAPHHPAIQIDAKHQGAFTGHPSTDKALPSTCHVEPPNKQHGR